MGWARRTRHLKQPFTLWESNHSGKWFQRRTSSVEPLKWRGTSSVARCHVTSSAWTRTTWTTNDHDLGLSPSRHGNEMCLQKRGKMLGDGEGCLNMFKRVSASSWIQMKPPGVSFYFLDWCHFPNKTLVTPCRIWWHSILSLWRIACCVHWGTARSRTPRIRLIGTSAMKNHVSTNGKLWKHDGFSSD